MKTQTRKLKPYLDLNPFLEGANLVAFSVGPDLRIYLLVALEKLEYYGMESNGVIAPITTTEQGQSYRALVFENAQLVREVFIQNETFNIHGIQPLPNDELLLVCHRTGWTESGELEKNGRVYSRNGEFLRDILLGDGISKVQTNSEGGIWTCYFDEGVGSLKFRNNGLVALDSGGNRVYDLPKVQHELIVIWSNALNVISDSSIWFHYYNFDSNLIHLVDRQVVGHWLLPNEGGWALAVGDGVALIAGDRDDPDTVRLFEFADSKEVKQIAEFELLDENRQRIRSEWGAGRGDALYLLPKNGIVYKFDIGMASSV